MRDSATSRTAALLTVLLGFACVANAAAIAVSNPSFEMPTAPPSGYGGSPVSWYYGGMAQVFNTQGNTPPALDGSQVLVLGGQQASWVYQDQNATWSGNYNYTLTLYGAYPSFSGQSRRCARNSGMRPTTASWAS